MSVRLSCDFCYRQCSLGEGQRGICHVREHRNGQLQTIGYGNVVASALDPVEKKPLYHVMPGALTFSFALFGCNYTCLFCQNHHISQKESPLYQKIQNDQYVSKPEDVVALLDESGSEIISYTYSEPIVWLDYVEAVATRVKSSGKYNCMVTNGSFSKSSLTRMLDLIDIFSIDLKGDEKFYRDYCSGELQPVLDSIATIAADSTKVLEVTTLIIEEVHTAALIREFGQILRDIGVQVWHLSRFFPNWKMSHYPATSEHYLEQMLYVAHESGIPYIYGGNSSQAQSTSCPNCKTLLINSHANFRQAGKESALRIPKGRCHRCGTKIYGLYL